MKKYFDTVINSTGSDKGAPVSGALVYVRDNGTNALVQLYSDDGVTPTGNPVTTNSLGYYEFFVADGTYKLEVAYSSAVQVTIPNVQVVDARSLPRAAATRDALAALDGSTIKSATLLESGREGVFVWDSSNLSSRVTADSNRGVYVPPASAPTGASGAWVRADVVMLNVRWFGAVGNNSTDDQAACNAAHTLARSLSKMVLYPTGYSFYVSEKIDFTGTSLWQQPGCVVRGAAAKDVFYWKGRHEAGYVAMDMHQLLFDGEIQPETNTNAASTFGRIGACGQRIGNAAIAIQGSTADDGGALLHQSPVIRVAFINPVFNGTEGWVATSGVAGLWLGAQIYRADIQFFRCHLVAHGFCEGIELAKSCTFDATADTVNCTAHGYTNGQRVAFLYEECEGASLPPELIGNGDLVLPLANSGIATAQQYYFVVNRTDDNFQVSLTSGGSAINFSTAGTGNLAVSIASGDHPYEIAPDEWTMGNISASGTRTGLTLVNHNKTTIEDLTIHPHRQAILLMNFPSETRARGDDCSIAVGYTEGPLTGSLPALIKYMRFGWNNIRGGTFQCGMQGADTGRIYISGSNCKLDFYNLTGTVTLLVDGSDNEIEATGSTDRSLFIDNGGNNKLVAGRRTSAGILKYAGSLVEKTSLPPRGGFFNYLRRNPSSQNRGDEYLFIPGLFTGPNGVALSDFYHDPTITMSGYPTGALVLPAALMASGRAFLYADGRTDSTSKLQIGRDIPAAWGTLYVGIKASTACTSVLTVGGTGVSVPVANTMSLTTSFAVQSVRYNMSACAAATEVFASIGATSVSADVTLAWLCFVPDMERMRAHQLALSGVTFSGLSNGGSTTIGNNIQRLQNTTTGTIATHTITMPAAPQDGDIVEIGTDGEITGLTLNANAGQSITGAATTLTADSSVAYFYRASTAIWYRKQ